MSYHSNLVSYLAEDTSVILFRLKVLLFEAHSLLCPELAGSLDLDDPSVFLTLLPLFSFTY